jgi:hypothetical protein
MTRRHHGANVHAIIQIVESTNPRLAFYSQASILTTWSLPRSHGDHMGVS